MLADAADVSGRLAAPEAPAAGCTWAAQDLPIPAGAQYAAAEGSSPNNTLITGWASFNKPRGVVWENGVLRQMGRSVPRRRTRA